MDLQGVSIPDLYSYAYGVPDKVCKTCMSDYHEYVDSQPMSPSYRSRGERRKQDVERETFHRKHMKWVEEAIQRGDIDPTI